MCKFPVPYEVQASWARVFYYLTPSVDLLTNNHMKMALMDSTYSVCKTSMNLIIRANLPHVVRILIPLPK